MQRFTELKVWQAGHALALSVYRLTSRLPDEERYGLSSQLRRAATGVPTNIAEGSKKATSRDYARYLNIAEGSLAETEYLLMLARDLGYMPGACTQPMFGRIDKLAAMLHALRKKVDGSGLRNPEPSTVDGRPSTRGAVPAPRPAPR